MCADGVSVKLILRPSRYTQKSGLMMNDGLIRAPWCRFCDRWPVLIPRLNFVDGAFFHTDREDTTL